MLNAKVKPNGTSKLKELWQQREMPPSPCRNRHGLHLQWHRAGEIYLLVEETASSLRFRFYFLFFFVPPPPLVPPCVRVYVRVRVCVRACVGACVRACVCVCVCEHRHNTVACYVGVFFPTNLIGRFNRLRRRILDTSQQMYRDKTNYIG